jgi:hypothetical protein
MRRGLQRAANSSTTHVAFAFLAMGGWAIFANRAYPVPRALLAGVVQGTLSACLTLFLKTAVERLSRRLSGTAALWAPPLIACVTSSTVLAAIHVLIRTPEISNTIALPLAVSTSYAAIYNYTLYRKADRHD